LAGAAAKAGTDGAAAAAADIVIMAETVPAASRMAALARPSAALMAARISARTALRISAVGTAAGMLAEPCARNDLASAMKETMAPGSLSRAFFVGAVGRWHYFSLPPRESG
jgi:hypothetical protein